MPFIQVNVTDQLTAEQKDAIKSGLGEKITAIPGKSERALMIDIADGHTLYMAGENRPHAAYLDVKIYGTTEVEYQKAFTEAAFEVMEQATGISKKEMYLTFSQFPNWGVSGTLK